MSYDHILLIGFGGPETAGEVRPFIRRVAQGRAIAEARLEEVEHHYERIGGASPYNREVKAFLERFRERLSAEALDLPVYLGMRNSAPFLKDTLAEIKNRDLCRGIGIILAPFRSVSSCFRYKQNIETARAENDASGLHYDYLAPWYDHPLFIQAQAETLRPVLAAAPGARLLFTAHSIPVSMNQACGRCVYEEDFRTSSALTAKALGCGDWQCVYQSRSGNPREPWLGPDIGEALETLKDEGIRSVVAVPNGFLCENAEVLYDLDIEAGESAKRLSLEYRRAPTVLAHPAIASLFAERISRLRSAGSSC